MISEDENMGFEKQLQEMAMTCFWFNCLTEMSVWRSGRPPSQRSVSTTMSGRNISQRPSYTARQRTKTDLTRLSAATTNGSVSAGT
jgi:hypothetical protein